MKIKAVYGLLAMGIVSPGRTTSTVVIHRAECVYGYVYIQLHLSHMFRQSDLAKTMMCKWFNPQASL